jgi:flavin reductase (DIM6/NTAB) family NADH-FMN oxidoreductase RutF
MHINCEATKEVVINVVNFDLVQQHPLQAQSMPINEFDKAGLTAVLQIW